MTQKERRQLKEKIVETIDTLEVEIKRMEENTQPVSPENSLGRITRMDAINNKSVAEATLRANRRKLSKLRVALSKIDDPDFGICARCRQPIPPARLMLLPESTLCVRCADL
jgi:DnaK suppressor protein